MIAQRKRIGRGNRRHAGVALPITQQGEHKAIGVDGDVVLLAIGAHLAHSGGFVVFYGRFHGDLRKLAADAVAIKQRKSGVIAHFGKGVRNVISAGNAIFQRALLVMLLADFVNGFGNFGRASFFFRPHVVKEMIQ